MLDAAARPTTPTDAPTSASERIGSLDTIRGIAALGILVMNAVSFGLDDAAYSNLAAAGNWTPIDWMIGALARVFIDQKMMATFSMLFGVGIVVFVERASAKGRRPIWLSLWRNLLLLGVGIAHTLLWDGDVLMLYAICAPLVLLLHKLPAKLLVVGGVALATAPAVVALTLSDVDAVDLGEGWFDNGAPMSARIESMLLFDGFGRALGLMLIGVALYRMGVVQGRVSDAVLRRMTAWGLAVGIALSGAGLFVHIATDWSASNALTGYGLSAMGTVPLALAYVALIVRWSGRARTTERWLSQQRIQNVGRMALTNYLTQTMLGVVVLTTWFADVALTRTGIAGFVVAVWALQLMWSTWWLDRFRFGPFEWVWRCATYRSVVAIRRD